jgi:hypothetical protein
MGRHGKTRMNLDEPQREQVRQWIDDGLQPAQIQKNLAEQFGVRLTYMEVRFLLDDLKVQIKDREQFGPAVVGQSEPERDLASLEAADKAIDQGPGGGAVSVTLDQVTRAGAVVSGRVRFSDGKSADWHLDQMGRLGLAPQEPGYRPTQEDVALFQTELQSALARLGY